MLLLPQSPTSLLAFCALAVLAASSPAPAAAGGEAGLFDAYVSSRLSSYHAHVAPSSPSLELARRSLLNPSSHASNPSRYSSSLSNASSSSSRAKPVYHLAPHVPSAAQVKVSRLENLKASSQNPGFAIRTKARDRSAKRSVGPQTHAEIKRATTGQNEARKKLWVRSEPEDAEGDESAEEESAEEETVDWSWMEHADEHEHEGDADEEGGILSSATRMEIRMKRSIPLFHLEP
ncbi:hypothetical protein JCM11251_005992 [Rhodosporidiobolus azoricus]